MKLTPWMWRKWGQLWTTMHLKPGNFAWYCYSCTWSSNLDTTRYVCWKNGWILLLVLFAGYHYIMYSKLLKVHPTNLPGLCNGPLLRRNGFRTCGAKIFLLLALDQSFNFLPPKTQCFLNISLFILYNSFWVSSRRLGMLAPNKRPTDQGTLPNQQWTYL